MTFVPATEARERILAFGGDKAGKTKGWVDIAKKYVETDTPGHFYVLDTDAGVRKSLAVEDAEYLRDRITIYDCGDWEEVRDAGKDIGEKVEWNDWFVGDSIGYVWPSIVQQYWIEKAYNSDPDEYFAQIRVKQLEEQRRAEATNDRARGTGYEFGGSDSTDWQYLKSIYLPWERRFTQRERCHVYFTAPAKPITKQTEDKYDQRYRKLGFAPGGEKDLVYRVHSVVYLSATSSGKRAMTVIADHDSERLVWGEDVTDLSFADFFLIDRAGWKDEAAEAEEKKKRAALAKKRAAARKRVAAKRGDTEDADQSD